MFSDLLNETKGVKYQITVDVFLKKYKHNGEIEFRPVYFNSVTKTVTNHIFKLENSFEEMLYMIDVLINNGYGWIIKLIESQYIKDAVTDMRYFVRSKFPRNLVHKKNFTLI